MCDPRQNDAYPGSPHRVTSCIMRWGRCATSRRTNTMTTRVAFLRLFFALLLGTVSMSLTGCGDLVVGGTAATTAKDATDRRTADEQVEDQAIELKTAAEMRVLFDDTARVNAMAYA